MRHPRVDPSSALCIGSVGPRDTPTMKIRWFDWVAIAVVCAPVVLWALLTLFMWFRCGPTYYASGFTEAKFATLREGMSTDEVLGIIGPPLETFRQRDGRILWMYSRRDDVTCNYEMRGVYFRDEKVKAIANMYWEE